VVAVRLSLYTYGRIAKAMATTGEHLDEKMGNVVDQSSGKEADLVGMAEPLNVDEKKLVRKLDLHLIPIVMLTYLLSFLDR
jgi:hypothetical protein